MQPWYKSCYIANEIFSHFNHSFFLYQNGQLHTENAFNFIPFIIVTWLLHSISKLCCNYIHRIKEKISLDIVIDQLLFSLVKNEI